MIRDKVVFGVCSDRVKERLLRELYLTFNKALYVCRTTETSTQHIESRGAMQAQALSVHTMQARKKGGRHMKATRMPKQSSNDIREYNSTAACTYCGTSQVSVQPLESCV